MRWQLNSHEVLHLTIVVQCVGVLLLESRRECSDSFESQSVGIRVRGMLEGICQELRGSVSPSSMGLHDKRRDSDGIVSAAFVVLGHTSSSTGHGGRLLSVHGRGVECGGDCDVECDWAGGCVEDEVGSFGELLSVWSRGGDVLFDCWLVSRDVVDDLVPYVANGIVAFD